jgi:hypothetical protein
MPSVATVVMLSAVMHPTVIPGATVKVFDGCRVMGLASWWTGCLADYGSSVLCHPIIAHDIIVFANEARSTKY